MHKRIDITVRDKIATAPRDAVYICGNSDFVIVFDFDEEWNEQYTKTARFVYNGTYQDVVFSGNECTFPVLSDANHVYVGAYAGNLRTTTPAYVSARKSILCGGGLPADPPPDVYRQIMERLDNGASQEQIAQAVEAYMLEHPPDTGVDFVTDSSLRLEDGVLSVNTATEVEQDNTLPVTSAAVHATVGNIEILLQTI